MSEGDVVVVEGGELEPVATCESFPNNWHLVTFGRWQVSVSADGLIRLPHSVLPETVSDLCGALMAAGEVGLRVRAANEAAEAEAALARRPFGSRGGIVVQAGPPPDGAVRLPVAPRSSVGSV